MKLLCLLQKHRLLALPCAEQLATEKPTFLFRLFFCATLNILILSLLMGSTSQEADMRITDRVVIALVPQNHP